MDSIVGLNLVPAIPEIFVLGMACVTLLASLFAPKRSAIAYHLAQLTLIVACVLTIYVFKVADGGQAVITFSSTFILDPLATVLKAFILLAVFFVFIYSRQYNDTRRIPSTEFYVLGLLSTLGMMVLVSSHSFITLFLGIELLALPTYAMVALWRTEHRCIEAAMKYFIIGAVASAMLLYGLSMLFGATQSLDISKVAASIASTPISQNMVLLFGLVFVVAGIAFKLGAAPFHMWVPDVYEGAPTSATLFISTAPKIAVFGLVVRLLVHAMPVLHVQWQEMLIVVAILSMAIGNFAAIAQTNLKRLLAYSSIAHIGYMLLGFICATPSGYAAAMFYVISYTVMTLGAFGMIILLSKAGFEAENIEDLKGLNNRHPWFALLMLIITFSLAGIPPFVGFIAKVGLLESLINAGFVWLAVVTLLFAIIGVYYYLRLIKVMYFEKADEHYEPIIVIHRVRWAMSINGAAVLLMGLFPGALYALCHSVF
jgi:NADH-quinone oxidoreductase subunit N